MPTIKQLIAEVQLAPIPDHHKRYIAKHIEEAEQRLKARAPKAPRKITNSTTLVTLEEWEAKEGCKLNSSMFAEWMREKALASWMVAPLIDEFRQEMIAKGKQYANFRATFQVYLHKGYLSRAFNNCLIEHNPARGPSDTVIHTRGGAL